MEASLLNGIFMTVLINRNVIKMHIRRMIVIMTTLTIHEHTSLVIATWLQVLLWLPWTSWIGGINLEASFSRHQIRGIADHTQTRNDVFFKSSILMVQHYRKIYKTIIKDVGMCENQSFLKEEVHKCIVWFWVCLTGAWKVIITLEN